MTKKKVESKFKKDVQSELFDKFIETCSSPEDAISIKYGIETKNSIEVCLESQAEKCAKCHIASFCPLFVPEEIVAK